MRDEDTDDDDNDLYVFDLWRCNKLAHRVFKCCQLTVIAGMQSIVVGISAAEFRAAALSHGVSPRPKRRFRELQRDVLMMGRAAAHYLNSRRPSS